MTGTAPTPAVSVVVPTYRRPALLRRCLDSLARQSADPATFEVVVVDDASGDGTQALLAEHARRRQNLRWFGQVRNAGAAAARNLGVRESRAPLLLFVDDDIVASPDLVATHLRLHDGAAVTHGVVGFVDWLPSLHPTAFMRWLDSTDLQFTYHTTLRPGLVEPARRAFYTSNVSLRRSLVLEAGGFDERLRIFEDIELGARLEARGFRLYYHPEALAWHARAISRRDFCRRVEVMAQSAVILHREHPELGVEPWGMLSAGRAPAVHWLLRAVSPALPRLLGRNLRSARYWADVAAAWRRGLVRAGVPLSAPVR